MALERRFRRLAWPDEQRVLFVHFRPHLQSVDVAQQHQRLGGGRGGREFAGPDVDLQQASVARRADGEHGQLGAGLSELGADGADQCPGGRQAGLRSRQRELPPLQVVLRGHFVPFQAGEPCDLVRPVLDLVLLDGELCLGRLQLGLHGNEARGGFPVVELEQRRAGLHLGVGRDEHPGHETALGRRDLHVLARSLDQPGGRDRVGVRGSGRLGNGPGIGRSVALAAHQEQRAGDAGQREVEGEFFEEHGDAGTTGKISGGCGGIPGGFRPSTRPGRDRPPSR